MSTWTNVTYTHKGLALLSKTTQGSSLKITRAVAGSGYVNPEVLANQTAVSGAKQELTFQTISYPETGKCKLPMFLTSEGVASRYTVKQVGLYARDPDEGEILFFIAQSDNGTVVPSEKEMPAYTATWTFYFRYGQADNVDVTVDPSNAITVEMLEEVRKIAEEGISTAAAGMVARHDNAAAFPLAGLKIFGRTTQNGTPAPDAPVDMVNVCDAGSVTTKIFGKNLCKMSAFNSMTINGADNTYDASTHTITVNEDTPAHNFTGRYCRPIGSECKVGTVYTISFDIKGTPGKKVSCGWDWNRTTITLSNTFTRHKSVKVAERPDEVVAFYSMPTENGGLAAGEYFQFANVQIEVGDATDFEAYKEPQAVAVSIPNRLAGVPAPSGGTYKDAEGQQWIGDEVNFAKGVRLQRVNRFTVSSADNGKVLGNTVRFSANLPADAPHDDGPAFGYGLCSHLPFLNAYGTDEPHFYTQGKLAWIFLPVECGTSVETVTAWLKSNPLDIIYQLKTPVETSLSAEELDSYAALTANNPVTTAYNDAGAWMELDCIEAQHESGIKVIMANGSGAGGCVAVEKEYTFECDNPWGSDDAIKTFYADEMSPGQQKLIKITIGESYDMCYPQLCSGTWFISLNKMSDTQGIVEAVSNDGKRAWRQYNNGWSEQWAWEIGLGASGDDDNAFEYLTTEQFMSADPVESPLSKNKPVYTKVVDMGDLVYGTSKTVSHGCVDVDFVVRCVGMLYGGANQYALPYDNGSGNTLDIEATNSAIVLKTSNLDSVSFQGKVCAQIWYTKK